MVAACLVRSLRTFRQAEWKRDGERGCCPTYSDLSIIHISKPRNDKKDRHTWEVWDRIYDPKTDSSDQAISLVFFQQRGCIPPICVDRLIRIPDRLGSPSLFIPVKV